MNLFHEVFFSDIFILNYIFLYVKFSFIGLLRMLMFKHLNSSLKFLSRVQCCLHDLFQLNIIPPPSELPVRWLKQKSVQAHTGKIVMDLAVVWSTSLYQVVVLRPLSSQVVPTQRRLFFLKYGQLEFLLMHILSLSLLPAFSFPYIILTKGERPCDTSLVVFSYM